MGGGMAGGGGDSQGWAGREDDGELWRSHYCQTCEDYIANEESITKLRDWAVQIGQRITQVHKDNVDKQDLAQRKADYEADLKAVEEHLLKKYNFVKGR